MQSGDKLGKVEYVTVINMTHVTYFDGELNIAILKGLILASSLD